MNKIDNLANIFGSMYRIARICDVSNSAVTKWKRNNLIPSAHHVRLARACPPEWSLELKSILDSCVCKCCGQEIK